MEDYMNYLKKAQRGENISLLSIHKRYLSREVARQYGLTEEEILNLDNELEG